MSHLESLHGYFEDFEIGDEFVTAKRTVTAEEIAEFAELSGDRHPLHTDPEFAACGPYGALIAYGTLTIALSTGLTAALRDPAQPSHVLAFYGMDTVRFLAPVKVGDSIRIEGEVIGLDAKDDVRGVVTFRHRICNQRGEVAVSLAKKTLHQRRAHA